jgi:hypothetical protein
MRPRYCPTVLGYETSLLPNSARFNLVEVHFTNTRCALYWATPVECELAIRFDKILTQAQEPTGVRWLGVKHRNVFSGETIVLVGTAISADSLRDREPASPKRLAL